MATMIPADISEFKTEGEGRFYRFLEQVAKPEDHYVAWYLPDIDGKEPDFILFSRQAGLIIFEVKDWELDQIIEADPHQFVLNIGGKREARKNPLLQARDYQGSVMDRIKEDGLLVSKDPNHSGKPKIPIKCGIVFSNINKHEYRYKQKEFASIISEDRIFFWDDLHPQSDMYSDPTGKSFSERLQTMFPPHFEFTLNGNEYRHLKQLIFPSIRIELPTRVSPGGYAEHVQRLDILDHHQEVFARRYVGGHQILFGPSGSGKTIVLVHKAGFLKQYNPSMRNILFLCYNITLIKYIKRLLSNKRIPTGENGVRVMHLLCSEILGEEVHYEKEDRTYYEMVTGLVLDRLKETHITYDAVLIDEGQDFSDDMYRVVAALLNPKTDNLTIALDDNQNIYRTKQTWKELGIKAKGRIHRISNVYRNTAEIRELADNFIGRDKNINSELHQAELFQGFFEYHGPRPEITRYPNFSAITHYVAENVLEMTEKEGYPLSEIAILYPSRSLKYSPDASIPAAITKALDSRGIMSTWVSENYHAKKSYDITALNVTISTIHSAKGLDYAVVFLLGLDLFKPGDIWTEEQIASLTYVGITRARYQLYIPYAEETPLIKKLLAWHTQCSE